MRLFAFSTVRRICFSVSLCASLFSLGAFGSILVARAVSAKTVTIEVDNSEVGHSAQVNSGQIKSNANTVLKNSRVQFTITKPDASTVTYSQLTDADGYIRGQVFGSVLDQDGDYTLEITTADEQTASDTFTVKGVPVSVRAHSEGSPSTQDIANDASAYVTFANETFDTGNFHNTSTDTEKFIAPHDGRYLIVTNVVLGSSGAASGTGSITCDILHDVDIAAREVFRPIDSAVINNTCNPTTTIQLSEGDEIKLLVSNTGTGTTLQLNQTSSASGPYSPVMSITEIP